VPANRDVPPRLYDNPFGSGDIHTPVVAVPREVFSLMPVQNSNEKETLADPKRYFQQCAKVLGMYASLLDHRTLKFEAYDSPTLSSATCADSVMNVQAVH
jgi:hypothetical protein